MSNRNTRNVGNLVVALVLIGLGALFLLGQFFKFNFWSFAWPMFIIVPGLLFFVGMVLGGKSAGGLAIPGSIVTMVGLILLYQNTFNHWESWAYAWALIFPTSVGIGLMIQGTWSNKPDLLRSGRQMFSVGIIIFVVAAAFFELVIGISGRGSIASYVWPVLLIGLGIYLLLRRGAPLFGAQPAPKAGDAASPFDASQGPAKEQ